MRLLLINDLRSPREEAEAWRGAWREARAMADPLAALGHLLWRIDPKALRECPEDFEGGGAWDQALEAMDDLRIEAMQVQPIGENIALTAFAVYAPHVVRDYTIDLNSTMVCLPDAIAFFESYCGEKLSQRVNAMQRLNRILDTAAQRPHQKLQIAAATLDVVERFVLWRLVDPHGGTWQGDKEANEALASLHRLLAQLCLVEERRELDAEFLEGFAAGEERPDPILPALYGGPERNENGTAMQFFERVYGPLPYLQRPYADQIRRDDPILYRRLTAALARKANGRARSIIELFPSRASARGGAETWRRDVEAIVKQDENRRRRDRNKMRKYREKLRAQKGKSST